MIAPAVHLAVPHQDLAGHAIAGWCIGLGAHGVTARLLPDAARRLRIAIDLAVPALAGLAKEYLYDRRHGGDVSRNDAATTFAGGIAAVSLTCRF